MLPKAVLALRQLYDTPDALLELLAQRGLPTASQTPEATKKPGESTQPANKEPQHPASNVPQQR